MFESGPLRLLPLALREPRRAWLAILVGWLVSFGGSALLSLAAHAVAPDVGKPEFALSGALMFVLLTVFAPVTETLIMALVLTLLARFVTPTAAVLVSALLWGIAHSLQAPAWGLIIWWPFLIFSTLFLVWRQRGFWIAVGIVATTHALQNLMPAVLVAFPDQYPLQASGACQFQDEGRAVPACLRISSRA